uniref:DUF4220 domain-containing protein n=1 Tax=Setaria italica TaxID=4555 RepID=K3ZHD2_SETIT
MVDVGSVIASFFIMLKQDLYVLIRIELLVALVTLLFLVMFVMDFYRCRSRSSIVTTILKTLDGLSDHIVVYLLGAMRSADFHKQLFPVWAIILVSLRASLGYLSGYNIADRERRVTEVSNVIQFIGTGVLISTPALKFTKPLWSLWAILTLRSVYRFWAHGGAVKSLWHGRSSEFLPEYLRVGKDDQHDWRNNLDNGENYLVYGETDQKIKIKKPEYVLQLNVTNPNSLITLDKVRDCSKPLLSSSISSRYYDMTLAFSLSRLLRCRIEDVPLHPDSTIRTRNLITSHIIGDQDQHAESDMDTAKTATRTFKILELELAFIRDYFCTLYPVVFWRGLLSLFLSLLQSIATFAVALWLAVDIRSLLKEKDDVEIRVGGFNVDLIITWVFLFFMMFKEVWEMVTYLLSNWTRLLLVCKYVQNQCWHIMDTGPTECLISSFFSSKLADPWHGRIDQYEFLQSCTYKPTFWKIAHAITLGKTPQKLDGRRSGNTIKIPECVKVAVLQELRRLDLNGQQLQRDVRSLRFGRYEWALFRLTKCSQSILVWHIATSLCEIKLAQGKNIDLSKPSFLRSMWSWLKEQVCCSSHPFLVDENISLKGQLLINYRIANSLSRYCAYLLVYQSELLPDSFITPEWIFETTLEYACNNLKDCESTKCRYDTLMAIAQEAVQDSELGKLAMNIVQQGAMLAKDLIDNEDEENRWDILAGVWTKLLVHIAPSWNAEAHKNGLESGGELITLIWALLWHCGVAKSSMWDDDRAPESTAQAPQENTTETRNTQFADEQEPIRASSLDLDSDITANGTYGSLKQGNSLGQGGLHQR